jgi:hypothetical protein
VTQNPSFLRKIVAGCKMQVARAYNWLIGQLNFGGEKIDSRFRGKDIKGNGNDTSLINTDTR